MPLVAYPLAFMVIRTIKNTNYEEELPAPLPENVASSKWSSSSIDEKVDVEVKQERSS